MHQVSAFSQTLKFSNLPKIFEPAIESNGFTAKGSCAEKFGFRSEFVLAIPNPKKCAWVGFGRGLAVNSTLPITREPVIEMDDIVCEKKACRQRFTVDVSGVGCDRRPNDVINGNIHVKVTFNSSCFTEESRPQGIRFDIGYSYTINELDAAAVHRIEYQKRHKEEKRQVSTVAKRELVVCTQDSDCDGSCADTCVGGVCTIADQATSDGYCQNDYYGVFGGCINVTKFYCDPTGPQYPLARRASANAFFYYYNPGANHTIGCVAPPDAYVPAGTPCDRIDEPGVFYDYYVEQEGICQGGGEGYCVTNNQAPFIGDSSTSTSSSQNDDLFNAQTSEIGQFNEGDFPLWIGKSASTSNIHEKQRGLPLEWEELITEPWVHADDEDVFDPNYPLVWTYPVDERLVDDDATNNDDFYNSLDDDEYYPCHVPLLLGPNGGGLEFCDGSANYTWFPFVTGRYVRPSAEDFMHDDDGKEDDGGDQKNILLNKADGFCSPACLCARVYFNGIEKRQIYFCNEDFFPVAGDSGNKVTRTWSSIAWGIWGIILAIILFMYAGLAWSAALFRAHAFDFVMNIKLSNKV